MKARRIILAGAMSLFATQALADKGPPAPPNYEDCTVEEQRQSATEECQECDDREQDACEKQWKPKGYIQRCQVKPGVKYMWREVWCKSGGASTEEPSTSSTTKPEATTPTTPKASITPKPKTAGACMITPGGEAPLGLILAALALLLRRRNHHPDVDRPERKSQ